MVAVLDSEAVAALAFPREHAKAARRAQAVLTAVERLGRAVATRAGGLLGQHRLDSRHAVDAFVAATALRERPAVVLTGDPDDLVRLVGDDPAVRVQPLP